MDITPIDVIEEQNETSPSNIKFPFKIELDLQLIEIEYEKRESILPYLEIEKIRNGV